MSNLVQLKGGMKAFGARALFEDASFSIDKGEKVGVIGPNGAGKSTLFRVLVGQESLDAGEITRRTGLRLGYLAQEDHWQGDETVEDHLLKQKVTPIWELKQMAPAFGLNLEHFDKPVRSLSGGYRMRVKLLKLLASEPDLMLLDEPTNYLDLETLLVLENFLQSTAGGFLVISHDREFLRRTTDHILEVEAGQITKYAGNIDDYFEQKELLREQLEKAALNLQAKRREVLDFAARFGAKAAKARQVQSRLKSLQKMEAIEVGALPARARIRLPEPAPTGKIVVKMNEAQLGYGDRVVLRGLDLEMRKGDHLGVVGVNGAGKSTLLRSLAGELDPLRGRIEFGLNVEVAFFAQHVAERLRPEDSVLEAMGALARADVTRQEILDLAGALLFTGDDVRKKVRMLSGGEKSRLALGQILLKKASCLLLDEPTNHLDFHTVEALTQALASYAGTVVIVSHDRGFVQRTASKILELKDGSARFYPGTYDEYVWSVQKGALATRRQPNADLASSARFSAPDLAESTPQTLSASPPSKCNYKELKKRLERDIRNAQKELVVIDREMDRARKTLLDINENLARIMGPAASELAKQAADSQNQIEQLEERYLAVLEAHERASQELDRIENRRTD